MHSLDLTPPPPTVRALRNRSTRHPVDIVWHVRSPSKIALTFDDGPDPTGTPAVLDELAEFSIPGTFFMVAAKARRHPKLVERVASEGHVVALHADVHAPLDRISAGSLTRRLVHARAQLEQLSGQAIMDHRPPLGRTSHRSLVATARAGLRLVMWSHDPSDWNRSLEPALPTRIQSCLVPGAIVLLHDGAESLPGQGRNTALALREVLPTFRDLGLQAVTLGAASPTSTPGRGGPASPSE